MVYNILQSVFVYLAADVTSKPVLTLPLSASITPAGSDESIAEMLVTMKLNGFLK